LSITDANEESIWLDAFLDLVTPSVVNTSSIEDARKHDDYAEEEEDQAGGQPQDGSGPVVQSTAPEPEQAATPEEVVTTPANDNSPSPTGPE
jgi:hypothetical protein